MSHKPKKSATHASQASSGAVPIYQDETGLERLVFFSDAVMAIAITLLALEIRLPTLPEEVSNGALWAALGALWPSYRSYLISFGVIGLYWQAHHRTFRDVERYDGLLMILNLLFLLCIAFSPFPTSVLGEYGNSSATIFYACTMAAIGFTMALVWWYTRVGGRLVEAPLARSAFRRGLLRVLLPPLIFLLSIPLALWNETAAQLFWILTALSLLLC